MESIYIVLRTHVIFENILLKDKTTNNEYNLFRTDAGAYEFYPDFIISGQTALTNDELLKELDDATTDIQNILDNSTSLLQASNVHYTIDKSTGSIDTRN